MQVHGYGSGESLKMTEPGLIHPGHCSKEYHDGDDDQIIGEDPLLFQKSGEKHVGIDIIKSDVEEIADEEKRCHCLRRNEWCIHRSRIKDQRKHQKTAPGGDVNNNLGSFFIQGENL